MSDAVPIEMRCPNGERCGLTIGIWMKVPSIFNPKPGEMYFWPGNPRRCSRECIAMAYDREFKQNAPSRERMNNAQRS